jgi:hypothetical protein
MLIQILLLGLVPLVVFAFMDYKFSPQAGVKGGIATAIILLFAVYHLTKQVDWPEVASVVILIGLGIYSLKKNDPLFFKLQPVIVAVIMGVALMLVGTFAKSSLRYYFAKLKPMVKEIIAQEMSSKTPHQDGLAKDLVAQDELAEQDANNRLELLIQRTPWMGFVLTLHGLWLGFAALKKSTGFWLTVRALQIPVLAASMILMELMA